MFAAWAVQTDAGSWLLSSPPGQLCAAAAAAEALAGADSAWLPGLRIHVPSRSTRHSSSATNARFQEAASHFLPGPTLGGKAETLSFAGLSDAQRPQGLRVRPLPPSGRTARREQPGSGGGNAPRKPPRAGPG